MFYFIAVHQQDVEYNCFCAVRYLEPDDLWRMPGYQRALLKVRIATDDYEAVIFGVLPNFRIAGALQSQ